MELAAKIEGLEPALAALRAAFPDSPRRQRSLLNQTMSGAARKTIIPMAKQLARQGDGSGALSEAIAPRAVSLSKALARGKSAIIEITPVRSNRKAMAMYIAHYYTARGKTASAKLVTSGIRHGHLVEFGHATRGGGFVSARPFLWPAGTAGAGDYRRLFADMLRRKIEAAVRRKRRR